MDHSKTIGAIRDWAKRSENIRAVVLTGSVAGPPGGADYLSDLDVELHAVDPGQLLHASAWYHQFGDVLVVEALENPGWHPTRLVHYVDGKIDFAISDIATLRHGTHDRPVRVLVDKDGLATDLGPPRSEAGPPRLEDVEECLSWFYAAALMEARLLARRELWLAKFREWDMICQLLRMVEWDHRARYGWSYDTWFNGKRISEWADPEVLAAAEACWAPYHAAAMAASVSRAVELFARLAQRVSDGLAIPQFGHRKVIDEVHRLLAVGGYHTTES